MHSPQHRRRRCGVDTMITTTTSEHYSEHHRQNNDSETTSTPKRRGKRRVSMAKLPPHILAQKHNDRGVQCVESAQYEEAITCFIKAFKFSQLDTAPPCECSHCSAVLSAVMHSPGSSTCQRRSDDDEAGNESDDEEFLYSIAILVPQQSQGHSMGQNFQILLAFNLALANHLSWATKRDTQDLKKLKRILQLYELSYNLQLEELVLHEHDIINLRFKLVILNNLSHIYRALNEEEQHHSVLEHLLSHLMLVVVTEQRNSARTDSTALAVPGIMDMDGFFKSTSTLLLKKASAGAA